MWKMNPNLAWGFKANFYKIINDLEPHSGYFQLLQSIKDKYDYFVCTSNIDGYFKKAGFDQNKIYEVHGSINFTQCMDKNCNLRNGISPLEEVPIFDPNTFITTNLPKCQHCGDMIRPNVSMFGDYEFYRKPYEHQRKRLNEWLYNLTKNNQSLIILEIGCGINPHSLRMSDGKMMSGEWKLPKITNLTKMIRLNPDDEDPEHDCIHVHMGSKQGIQLLM